VLKTVQLFRMPLTTLMDQQRARLQADLSTAGASLPFAGLAAGGAGASPLGCGIPLILLDCLVQLRALGACSCEGIFRIPGDANEIQELRAKYESGEMVIYGAEAGE
jgi:hypothetical protein